MPSCTDESWFAYDFASWLAFSNSLLINNPWNSCSRSLPGLLKNQFSYIKGEYKEHLPRPIHGLWWQMEKSLLANILQYGREPPRSATLMSGNYSKGEKLLFIYFIKGRSMSNQRGGESFILNVYMCRIIMMVPSQATLLAWRQPTPFICIENIISS